MTSNRTIVRAFKYRLHPTAEQAERMQNWFGATRFVYNLAREQREMAWNSAFRDDRKLVKEAPEGLGYQPLPSKYGQDLELPALKKEAEWLKDCPAWSLQAALDDLDKAYKAFFKGHAHYPDWRKKHKNNSFRYNGQNLKITKLNKNWAEASIPKMSYKKGGKTRQVRFRLDRELLGKVKQYTVSWDGQDYWISFICDIEIAEVKTPTAAIGIDRGVSVPLMLSDGSEFHLPAAVGELAKRHKKAQRALSRRKLGSARRTKARQVASGLKAKQTRVRREWQHKTTTEIVSKYGYVAVEELKTKNMTRSAKGTAEEPGKNVKAKSGLNREILNVGWFEIQRQLDYKLDAIGGELDAVDPKHTSQSCSECGHTEQENRKSQAKFKCTSCGHTENADRNAAKNILSRSRFSGVTSSRTGLTGSLGVEDVDSGTVETLTTPSSAKSDQVKTQQRQRSKPNQVRTT